LKSRSREF